jgi:thiol-disulfide isomerase/thioredoxin
MLNFWATWCAPCRREIPLLETLRRDWSAQGFEVIGIAVDHRPDVVDFARRLNIDYPLLVGEEDALDVAAAVGFESPAFPFTVFTDRKSRVVALFVGELHPPQANLILTTVERLNAGDIELAAARSTIRAGLRKLR